MEEKEWWVYVRNGSRCALPVGPFGSRAEADGWVQPTCQFAEKNLDGHAGFYEWGVMAVPGPTGRRGNLNAVVGYPDKDHSVA